MQRIARIAALTGLMVSVFCSAITVAQAQGATHTVRYSYEKWSRVEPARYVLVPKPTRIKGNDFAEKTRQLMRLLIAEKRGTYGTAKLAFQKDYVKNPVVYVWLDKTKANYHPIVMAETVYTFTENGALKVVFPEVKPAGMTRSDVPFSSYLLSVPFWQALPPTQLTAALVQMPDGRQLMVEEAIENLKKGEPSTLKAIWRYFEGGGGPAIAAAKAAIALKLDGVNDRLIPLLQSANKALRRVAIDGLKSVDMPAVNKALRSVVDDDPDAELRDLAASILSKSTDPQFAATAQYHALKSKDPKIVLAAAEALGQSKLPEASKELLKIIAHEDHRVRAAVISSLVARNDYKTLISQLGRTSMSKEVRLEVAERLTKGSNKDAAFAGLCFLTSTASAERALTATRQLGSYNKPKAYETLGKALKHADSSVRKAAANALSKLGKVAGLPFLASADIDDEESGDAVREAIRRVYGQQNLDYVMKSTSSKTPVLKQLAVATLGDFVKSGKGKRSRKKILTTLRKLSKSADAEIRAAATQSLGIMGGEDLRDDIMRLSGDSAVQVTRAVAAALGNFPGPKTTAWLLKNIKSTDDRVVAHSAKSLGQLKVREATTPLSEQMNSKAVIVRRAATKALVSIGATLKQRKPLLSLFGNRLFDSDGEVRLIAVQGLRLVKDARTVTALGALLQDPLKAVRVATLDAMADTGHISAIQPIAAQLDDEDKEIRLAALRALKRLGKKEARKSIEKYLTREKDPTLISLAKSVLKALK